MFTTFQEKTPILRLYKEMNSELFLYILELIYPSFKMTGIQYY